LPSDGEHGGDGFTQRDRENNREENACIGYADVTSQMGTHLTGDPRDVALRDALYSAIQARV